MAEDDPDVAILIHLLAAVKRDPDFAAYVNEYGYSAALTYLLATNCVDSLGQMEHADLVEDISRFTDEQINLMDPTQYHD